MKDTLVLLFTHIEIIHLQFCQSIEFCRKKLKSKVHHGIISPYTNIFSGYLCLCIHKLYKHNIGTMIQEVTLYCTNCGTQLENGAQDCRSDSVPRLERYPAKKCQDCRNRCFSQRHLCSCIFCSGYHSRCRLIRSNLLLTCRHGYINGSPIIFGCHRRPERSFFYKGRQFPICARCTGGIGWNACCRSWICIHAPKASHCCPANDTTYH